MSHSDLDDRAIEALKEFNEEGALQVLLQFKDSDLSHVQVCVCARAPHWRMILLCCGVLTGFGRDVAVVVIGPPCMDVGVSRVTACSVMESSGIKEMLFMFINRIFIAEYLMFCFFPYRTKVPFFVAL